MVQGVTDEMCQELTFHCGESGWSRIDLSYFGTRLLFLAFLKQ
jgi:hypothetical protein